MSSFSIKHESDQEPIAYQGVDLIVTKETASQTDDAGRWIGPPRQHIFRLQRKRRSSDGSHWLFRTAVSSLSWDNAGEHPPQGEFVLDRASGVAKRATLLRFNAKGIVVTAFSFHWSEDSQTIVETMSIKVLQLESVKSDLHVEVLASKLAELRSAGPIKI